MAKFKMVRDVKVMEGTRAYEWLESKDPADHKRARRLMEFCDKASAVNYEYGALVKLRQEYQDVV